MRVPIDVRPAALADLETIVGFNADLARESERLNLDPDTLRAGVRWALEHPQTAPYFLAEAGGETAGQCMLTFEWSDWQNARIGWLQSVYVEPRHRRSGVLRALLNHVHELGVRDHGLCCIRLYVHRDNRSAAAAYDALGFKSCLYEILQWSPGGFPA